MRGFAKPNRSLWCVFFVVVLGVTTAFSAGPPSAAKTHAAASYGDLPLSFEANRGQTDASVRFLSRGNGYTFFLTPSEAVLTFS